MAIYGFLYIRTTPIDTHQRGKDRKDTAESGAQI